MKHISTLLLTIILITISTVFAEKTIFIHHYYQVKYNKEDIYRTWYVKQILINGKPDVENYPVNNDELTLNADFNYISIDRTYNMTEKGKWKWLTSDSYLLNSELGPVSFKILELSNAKLRIKMISDEINMEVILSSVK